MTHPIPDAALDDRGALKAENARLTKALNQALAAMKSGPLATWPDQREEVARLSADNSLLRQQMRQVIAEREHARSLLSEIFSLARKVTEPASIISSTTNEASKIIDQIPAPSGGAPAPARREPATPPKVAPRPEGGVAKGDLPGPQQRILDSLAWWRAFGIEQPTNEQVAFIAGYSPTSTGYTNPRSALRTAGLIEYPSGGAVAMTDAGAERADSPDMAPTREEMHRRVIEKLNGPQRRILEPLIDQFPDMKSNEWVASAAGYSATSTGYTNPRSSLRTLNLIEYPSPGYVRAADWLFP